MAACRSSLENIGKMNLKTCFEQNFTTGSFGVGIGHAWCSWEKAIVRAWSVERGVGISYLNFFEILTTIARETYYRG
jgi:hypothetical protein